MLTLCLLARAASAEAPLVVFEHRHDPIIAVPLDELGQSQPQHSAVSKIDIGQHSPLLDVAQVLLGEFVEMHLGGSDSLTAANGTLRGIAGWGLALAINRWWEGVGRVVPRVYHWLAGVRRLP